MGLAFSNVIQMLVFYTWVVRFIAESISLFHSVEGVSGARSSNVQYARAAAQLSARVRHLAHHVPYGGVVSVAAWSVCVLAT